MAHLELINEHSNGKELVTLVLSFHWRIETDILM